MISIEPRNVLQFKNSPYLFVDASNSVNLLTGLLIIQTQAFYYVIKTQIKTAKIYGRNIY